MARITAGVVDEIFATVESRVTPRIHEVFVSCFTNTLESTIEILDDDTAYMVTGDIPAMWLRDSAAQLAPYLHFAQSDPVLHRTIASVVERQLRYILLDPYANAFNREANGAGHSSDHTQLSPWVWERKYEVDSLCYPIQLAHDLWKVTGDASHLTGTFRAAAIAIMDLIVTEQDHEARSSYRFERFDGAPTDTLLREGRGPLVAPTGLTWSGFRPSDDACVYGYNIPGNAFAAVELMHIAEIARDVLGDENLAHRASTLSEEIRVAIMQHGVVDGRFAYEVDGLGGVVLMDDANAPSLLSLPLFGWCAPDDSTYAATRRFILSDANPYYFSGSAARGVGSPHTPPDHVWPIALAIQGLTSVDPAEQLAILETLSTTDAGTGLMHESFHKDDPSRFTREWFSWANSMYCELVLEVAGLRSHRRAPMSIEPTP